MNCMNDNEIYVFMGLVINALAVIMYLLSIIAQVDISIIPICYSIIGIACMVIGFIEHRSG